MSARQPLARVIAIDGPAGVGKSTVSKLAAKMLGWTYLDTGAMYRTVTLAWLRAGQIPGQYAQRPWLASLHLDFSDNATILNGQDVSSAIREPSVNANVSAVSAEPAVRQRLTAMQREIAEKRPCVLDGRDIGTVVFPNAFLKVFLTAPTEVRARRRWLEQGGESSGVPFEQVLAELRERDRKDASREVAPLKQADDAWELSTVDLDAQGVAEAIVAEALRRSAEPAIKTEAANDAGTGD